jgi:hypothetical protein
MEKQNLPPEIVRAQEEKVLPEVTMRQVQDEDEGKNRWLESAVTASKTKTCHEKDQVALVHIPSIDEHQAQDPYQVALVQDEHQAQGPNQDTQR